MRFFARLLPSHDVDALIGDILEESHRRSRIWRWYQLVALVVVISGRVVRAHPMLTLRAIAIGVAVFLAYFQVFGIWILNNVRLGPLPASNAALWLLVQLFFCLGLAASGWAIGRLHLAQGIAMVLPFAILMAVLGLSDFVRSALTLHSWSMFETFKLAGLLAKSISFPGSVLVGGYWAIGRVDTV